MIKLSKEANRFILITLLLGYLSFGFLLTQAANFNEIIDNPLYLIILLFGLVSPFISAVITKITVSYMDFNEIIKEIVTIKNKSMIYLVVTLLFMHYLAAIVLGFVGAYGDLVSLITIIPAMIIIFGLSEYGWRSILFTEVRKEMGFYKSNVVIGLFMAVFLIPLVFIPGFVVGANVFIPFSAYLIGMSLLSTTVYMQTKSISLSMIFVGLFVAASTVVSIEVGNALLVMFVVDLVIAIAYNAKALNKTPQTIKAD